MTYSDYGNVALFMFAIMLLAFTLWQVYDLIKFIQSIWNISFQEAKDWTLHEIYLKILEFFHA